MDQVLQSKDRVTEWISKQNLSVCSLKETPQIKRHTDKKRRERKKIPMQMEAKENWSTNTYIKQNRL